MKSTALSTPTSPASAPGPTYFSASPPTSATIRATSTSASSRTCTWAFGVDAEAIRPRKLYLPWEAGKPPDLALEVASESTAQNDVRRKPDIYARIGVPEYWRFDPTGGRYYDAPLTGLRLVNGVYQTIELTTEPDGILKGYSTVLELSLCWDQGWPRLYNPATGTYLENARQVWDAREAADLEIERLREQLRRLQSES